MEHFDHRADSGLLHAIALNRLIYVAGVNFYAIFQRQSSNLGITDEISPRCLQISVSRKLSSKTKSLTPIQRSKEGHNENKCA